MPSTDRVGWRKLRAVDGGKEAIVAVSSLPLKTARHGWAQELSMRCTTEAVWGVGSIDPYLTWIPTNSPTPAAASPREAGMAERTAVEALAEEEEGK